MPPAKAFTCRAGSWKKSSLVEIPKLAVWLGAIRPKRTRAISPKAVSRIGVRQVTGLTETVAGPVSADALFGCGVPGRGDETVVLMLHLR
ncbi:hypothetical protein RKD54_002810 [Pseudarthrobacter sp. SLBN-100]